MASLLHVFRDPGDAPPDAAGGGAARRLHLPSGGVAALCADPADGSLAVAPCDPAAATRSGDVVALLVAHADGGRVRHVCLALAPLYLNADALPVAGLAVLRERDCLACAVGDGIQHLFYDVSAPPEAAPFAGQTAVECPWCRQPLLPGQPCVACPSCGVVCHQDATSPCWQSAPACPRCGSVPEAASPWRPAGVGLDDAGVAPNEEVDDAA